MRPRMDELQKTTWGGYRHGRKRRSTISTAALHVNIRRETHAILKHLAEKKQLTMGEVLDLLIEKHEGISKKTCTSHVAEPAMCDKGAEPNQV